MGVWLDEEMEVQSTTCLIGVERPDDGSSVQLKGSGNEGRDILC
jgi:hypothetical protein